MKITMVTQAYNAKKYIRKCVESVLNQTYTDFEYILVDNGSQDGTRDILQEYAQQDKRIKFKRFEKNIPDVVRWIDVISEIGTGDYAVNLDADDWYDKTFLERMVDVIENTNCDIAVTGTAMHNEGNNSISYRATEHRMVIDRKDFANVYPYYHAFFRTVWAKLVRMDIIRKTPAISSEKSGLVNGLDTVNAFAWLRNANRICIDNSLLHHYLIHKKNLSHVHHKQDTNTDLYLFRDAVNFLSTYGPISPQNMVFLYVVYSNAIRDTHTNIKISMLSPEEKLEEYRIILSREETQSAFSLNIENTNKIKKELLSSVLDCASYLTSENNDFNTIKSIYFPVCANAVFSKSARLILSQKALFDALLQDNRDAMVNYLLSMITKQKMVKQYNLVEILEKLVQDKLLLAGLSDMKFLRKFHNIYWLVFQEKYNDALEMMTDILLKQTPWNETFLQLYLSLAAFLECVDAFLFGQVKLAAFYCVKKQKDKCREVLDALTAMGVQDNDEILQIKERLKGLCEGSV